MNVLVVFSHPKRKGSFNHAVLAELTKGLAAGGHNCEVVNLYGIDFDPVFRERDYAFFADESIPGDILETMGWRNRILEVSGRGPFGFLKRFLANRWLRRRTLPQILREVRRRAPRDVVEQQQKVAWADGLILVSPIIWMHYPAIMKGWLERVFSYGFAYSLTPEGWKGSSAGRVPLLQLKKALSINTTFFTQENYRESGFQDAMSKLLLDWNLRYPGVPEAELVCFHAVSAVGEKRRKLYLEEAFTLGKEF